MFHVDMNQPLSPDGSKCKLSVEPIYYYYYYYYYCIAVVEDERILPLYSLQIVKGDVKGWSDWPGKPLCISRTKGHNVMREGRVKCP